MNSLKEMLNLCMCHAIVSLKSHIAFFVFESWTIFLKLIVNKNNVLVLRTEWIRIQMLHFLGLDFAFLLRYAGRNDPAFCPYGCGHVYRGHTRKRTLKKHMMYSCGVNPQFECTICHKKLRHKYTLHLHMVKIHRQVTH